SLAATAIRRISSTSFCFLNRSRRAFSPIASLSARALTSRESRFFKRSISPCSESVPLILLGSSFPEGDPQEAFVISPFHAFLLIYTHCLSVIIRSALDEAFGKRTESAIRPVPHYQDILRGCVIVENGYHRPRVKLKNLRMNDIVQGQKKRPCRIGLEKARIFFGQ